MRFFTICSRNFMAQAYTLYESLVAHHPDAKFSVALCDEVGDFDLHSFPFQILKLADLQIAALPKMIQNYNITELNTAIKPFVFDYFFQEDPNSVVVYLDPDIQVISRLEELEAAFTEGADCVLTPHMTEPCEWAEMHEGRILQFGAYNLGFLGLRGTDEVQSICRWWARRLETDCVIDLGRALFVDQKWADLFPSFITRTHILRHPGYNVAYWNLSHRRVTLEKDVWLVNGELLRFFHFSGSVVSVPTVFSRHSQFFTKGGLRDLDKLFANYCQRVRENGNSYYNFQYPFSYNWSSAGGVNLHTPEAVSRKNTSNANFTPDLFSHELFPHLSLLRAGSLSEFEEKRGNISEIESQRRDTESELVPSHDPFTIEAYCVICGDVQVMPVSSMYSPGNYEDGRSIPNWREHVNCKNCGFTNRLRATLHVLYQEIAPAADDHIYLTEQKTPLFDWFSNRYDNVTGSEYFGDGHAGGDLVQGLRHEDIQNLSFPDESFDLVISLEVLEHVPFPDRAFRELRRCLKPGGRALLTAPFRQDSDTDEIRAHLTESGEIEHILEPEYHGNPVDPEGGALCFRYFGWNIVEDLKTAGFSDAEVVMYWSRKYGYLGNTNAIIIAHA